MCDGRKPELIKCFCFISFSGCDALYIQCKQPIVCLYVCQVHRGKTDDQIWMLFRMVGQMGPAMKQVVGFGDWSMKRGYFGAPDCVP